MSVLPPSPVSSSVVDEAAVVVVAARSMYFAPGGMRTVPPMPGNPAYVPSSHPLKLRSSSRSTSYIRAIENGTSLEDCTMNDCSTWDRPSASGPAATAGDVEAVTGSRIT